MSELASAFDVDGLVCLVGAGGKKTTLYALAARADRAVVTASVRIPIFDPHVGEVVVTEEPLTALENPADRSWPLGLVPEREFEDRYRGYDPETVAELAAAHDGPVLVKADGARMREFKAPAGNEPQVPATADTVVPVASAHVIGEPLTDALVHRPERVAQVADVAIGDEVTPEVVGRVLATEEGGLKDVPEGATVVPLLNKVDDAADEQAARAVAETVLDHADRSVVPRVVLARMAEAEVIDVLE